MEGVYVDKDGEPKPAPPGRILTDVELHMIEEAIASVCSAGFGSVTIAIEEGHVRFISPAPSFDMRRAAKYQMWDRLENKPK